MRRLAALLLIATSGWLLYQTTEHIGGFSQINLSDRFLHQLSNMNFVLPALGGLLGLLGGLIVFFGGVGGAALAIMGGVLAAGFSLYVGQSLFTDDIVIWKNEAIVGLAMLILAGFAALMGRD